MLLPASCPICGRLGAAPCGECVLLLRRAPPGPLPPYLDACHAFLAYDGAAARDLVARLKYRNARSALGWLAQGVAALVDARAVSEVTWAPTTPDRRRARGFDQAELLARRVSRTLGRPCHGLLRRRPGPHQTGRTLSERRHGVAFEPAARLWRRPPTGPVLVVDDVVTSGASLAAAAKTLRAAGVPSVLAAAAARTP